VSRVSTYPLLAVLGPDDKILIADPLPTGTRTATLQAVWSTLIKLRSAPTPPLDPQTGQFYYDTTLNHFYVWSGTEWRQLDEQPWNPPLTDALTSSQISDFDAAVEALIPAITVDSIPELPASKITSGAFDLARIPTMDTDHVPSLDAAKTTSGAFDTARIPSLDAGKITSGTLDLSRVPTMDTDHIPSLDAGKITSGAFDTARIPTLDAAKIGSGTLDTARVPSLDAAKTTSGTFDLARIPTMDVGHIPALDHTAISDFDSEAVSANAAAIATALDQAKRYALMGL
jgi:hypothetical protein